MRNGDLKAGNSYFFLFTPVVAGRPTATTETDSNQNYLQERGITHFTDTNQGGETRVTKERGDVN